MTYTVLWKPDAEDELARLWTGAADRDAVTKSADWIDAALHRDPRSKGESRTGDIRILVVPPLAVRFEVRDADRTVYVLQVWHWGRPP
jgi:hypothetical protein